MCKDMEGLQNAELTLEKLQKELEEARLAEKTVASEKENLEKRLQESEADSTTLQHSISDGEVSQLKAEIEARWFTYMLRSELQLAESKLHDRCWTAPPGLQQWLQLTHEIENKAYVKKKLMAEKQLQQAREACEKLRKKRSSLVGAFVSTHGKSIDDVDRTIVEARTSLNEVTQELQERVHRWKQVEYLCGFNIIQNMGLQALENSLYRGLNGRPFGLLKGRISSQDDLDDDTSSIYTPSTGHVESWAAHTWKEADSSGSEASKQEEDVEIRSPPGSVNFLVGGEVSNWGEEPAPTVPKHTRVVSQPPSFRSISNTNMLNNNKTSNMVRSYSQDVNIGATEVCLPNTKSSYSDTSLDYMDKRKSKKIQHKQQTIREQPSASTEDICSTDSSVVDEDPKRKKKKFFSFGKKTMEKAD
ncbi:stromal interaction molecule [Holotrichia oblita]|uniref:Stromal interaction molecule n=1 Tax=Holotrichia oblita TaxID=644536 RepID=A0ACB9TAU1_HOLOL|nr:stromal interaction molecule [Holotrichia oblita]